LPDSPSGTGQHIGLKKALDFTKSGDFHCTAFLTTVVAKNVGGMSGTVTYSVEAFETEVVIHIRLACACVTLGRDDPHTEHQVCSNESYYTRKQNSFSWKELIAKGSNKRKPLPSLVGPKI